MQVIIFTNYWLGALGPALSWLNFQEVAKLMKVSSRLFVGVCEDDV